MLNKLKKPLISFFLNTICPFVLILILGVSFGRTNDNRGLNKIDSNVAGFTAINNVKTNSFPQSYTKHTYWTSNYGHTHRGTYRISLSDYYSSIRARANASNSYSLKEIYIKVIQNDIDNLDNIFSIFNRIIRDKNYNTYEFADVIVSFVQDIPYSLIYNDTGIYAPIEFLKKYTGDCDTRTVLLFILLNAYGYDTVILNSYVYKHSVIGISLPTSGYNYKYSNGKKYYTWETTAKGWRRGNIHSSNSNMYNWEIGLKLN